MKKIAIVLFVAATALAGCGKKKAPEAPAGGDQGSAAPAGEMTGSDQAAPEGSDATAPEGGEAAPEGGEGGGGGM